MNRGPLCPECGHPEYFHRSSIATQHTPVDGPTPCFAVVGRRVTTVSSSPLRHSEDYDFCGCELILPLRFW